MPRLPVPAVVVLIALAGSAAAQPYSFQRYPSGDGVNYAQDDGYGRYADADAGDYRQDADGRYDTGSRYDDPGDAYYDDAQVLRVDPILAPPRPRFRQQCWREPDQGAYYQTRYRDPGVAAPLLGAVVGGALGNQFGSGDGRRAVTIAGAVLGAAAGNAHRAAYSGNYADGDAIYAGPRMVERCETVAERGAPDERVVGYDVTYRYHDRVLHTRSDAHPGDRIRVRVQVQPDR